MNMAVDVCEIGLYGGYYVRSQSKVRHRNAYWPRVGIRPQAHTHVQILYSKKKKTKTAFNL